MIRGRVVSRVTGHVQPPSSPAAILRQRQLQLHQQPTLSSHLHRMLYLQSFELAPTTSLLDGSREKKKNARSYQRIYARWCRDANRLDNLKKLRFDPSPGDSNSFRSFNANLSSFREITLSSLFCESCSKIFVHGSIFEFRSRQSRKEAYYALVVVSFLRCNG